MSADLVGVTQAISEARAEILKELGDVKADLSRLDGTLTASLAAVKDTHDTFRQELLGPGGRVVGVEEDIKTQVRRQWVHTVVVLPVIAALHGAANYLGWKV